ncbi:MAG TPA: ABC transporter ATP-binding protein [Firmicutes bacterium]|nr:ABC transporter ATP-binding protein [Bacillota bacterium]
MTPLLELKNVVSGYGSIRALKDVSATVDPGEAVAIIGSNGAGKSTMLKTVCGLVRPFQGQIVFNGKDITGWEAERVAAAGIALVPEGRRVFPRMTVLENLLLGAYTRTDRAAISEDLDKMYDLFPKLYELKARMAGSLSGGEQQMLAFARALMSKPRLLLLDEPSMGLAPIIVSQIYNTIATIRKAGVTIVLVEQNAKLALSAVDRAYVMETGRIVLEGRPEEILQDQKVMRAYLGVS